MSDNEVAKSACHALPDLEPISFATASKSGLRKASECFRQVITKVKSSTSVVLGDIVRCVEVFARMDDVWERRRPKTVGGRDDLNRKVPKAEESRSRNSEEH